MLTFPKESRQTLRARQRAEEKAARSKARAEKVFCGELHYMLRQAFPGDSLEKAAIKSGLITRQRELTALAFAGVLIMGCVCDTSDSGMKTLKILCSLLRQYFNIDIEPQALQQKINTEEATIFIKEVVTGLISFKINKFLNKIIGKREILPFRILLQDSTVISLPSSMKSIFKGCGGSASEAAVKCDFIIDQSNGTVVRAKLTAGNIPDSSMSVDIIEFLQENDIVIRDLGYFNLSHFSSIIKKAAKFISRLSKSTNVYLNKEDQEPLDLIEHLKKIAQDNVDIELYMGKHERVLVRLIAIKVPPEVMEERNRKHKENRKKDPSEDLQEWNGYTLMITNIHEKDMSLGMITKLYKIRWQIELLFKNVKSNLSIDNITGFNKCRILCIIYIKIAIVFFVLDLCAYAQGLVGQTREVSLDQLTKWLKEEGRLKRALVGGNLFDLLKEIARDVDLLCKQKKRKRRTTLCDVEESYKAETKERSRTLSEVDILIEDAM